MTLSLEETINIDETNVSLNACASGEVDD